MVKIVLPWLAANRSPMWCHSKAENASAVADACSRRPSVSRPRGYRRALEGGRSVPFDPATAVRIGGWLDRRGDSAN
jgi:hypothetical protein